MLLMTCQKDACMHEVSESSTDLGTIEGGGHTAPEPAVCSYVQEICREPWAIWNVPIHAQIHFEHGSALVKHSMKRTA